MAAQGRKIFEIVAPYCDKIRFNSKHYTCFPKGYNRTITFAASSSDRNQAKQVYRDFRRYAGIEIVELLKS